MIDGKPPGYIISCPSGDLSRLFESGQAPKIGEEFSFVLVAVEAFPVAMQYSFRLRLKES